MIEELLALLKNNKIATAFITVALALMSATATGVWVAAWNVSQYKFTIEDMQKNQHAMKESMEDIVKSQEEDRTQDKANQAIKDEAQDAISQTHTALLNSLVIAQARTEERYAAQDKILELRFKKLEEKGL